MVLTDEERRLKANERARKWREENPEKANATARKSYQKNKEKINKKNKIVRATPEFKAKAKVAMDKWREENKEYEHKYREGRRDEYNAHQQKSRHKFEPRFMF